MGKSDAQLFFDAFRQARPNPYFFYFYPSFEEFRSFRFGTRELPSDEEASDMLAPVLIFDEGIYADAVKLLSRFDGHPVLCVYAPPSSWFFQANMFKLEDKTPMPQDEQDRILAEMRRRAIATFDPGDPESGLCYAEERSGFDRKIKCHLDLDPKVLKGYFKALIPARLATTWRKFHFHDYRRFCLPPAQKHLLTFAYAMSLGAEDAEGIYKSVNARKMRHEDAIRILTTVEMPHTSNDPELQKLIDTSRKLEEYAKVWSAYIEGHPKDVPTFDGDDYKHPEKFKEILSSYAESRGFKSALEAVAQGVPAEDVYVPEPDPNAEADKRTTVFR